MILLHRQHVVGLAAPDGLSNLGLGSIASIVTMQPSSARVCSNSGIAVISFDWRPSRSVPAPNRPRRQN